MDLLPELKEAFKRLGIKPKKSFGQNFMVESSSLKAVREALHLAPQDELLEIGPGLGFLTRYLLESEVRFIAVEKDTQLAEVLSQAFAHKNIRCLNKDILELDIAETLKPTHPIKVVGNIPYYITSPIVEWLIDQKKHISLAVLTVQWEVALRLTAKPGSKVWGALSVFAQYHSKVSLIRKIPRGHFHPAPKVDSAIIQLDFQTPRAVKAKDEKIFFLIVRRAFQKRRKTLLNALKDDTNPMLEKKILEKCMQALSIDPMRRPETLTLKEWSDLSDALFDFVGKMRV